MPDREVAGGESDAEDVEAEVGRGTPRQLFVDDRQRDQRVFVDAAFIIGGRDGRDRNPNGEDEDRNGGEEWRNCFVFHG